MTSKWRVSNAMRTYTDESAARLAYAVACDNAAKKGKPTTIHLYRDGISQESYRFITTWEATIEARNA